MREKKAILNNFCNFQLFASNVKGNTVAATKINFAEIGGWQKALMSLNIPGKILSFSERISLKLFILI